MYLTPNRLLNAYAQGIFPMADDDGEILWFDPDPRAILPLADFHVSRSLQRTLRRGIYEIRCNSRFEEVMRGCAESKPGREETWISPELIEAYSALHRFGYAHSVEAWHEGRLVGGLYGVAINGFFAGESMFSHMRDASKVALVALVNHLRAKEFLLLDIQFLTAHLEQFGALELPRSDYRHLLALALSRPVQF